MMEGENCCTASGQCRNMNNTLHCTYKRPAFTSGCGRCIFQVWESEKCLSPHALTAARMQEAQNGITDLKKRENEK